MPGDGSFSRRSGSLGHDRRTGLTDIFMRDQEIQERAMKVAESLMRHELSKRSREFKYLRRGNITKLLLLVISLCSYLTLLHADFHTEFYSTFVIQLGTSTPLIPSMFRVSFMSLRFNLASPIIDIFFVLTILVHQLMAAVTLLLTVVNTTQPNISELLYFNAALLFAGTGVCLAEIGAIVFSAQLQRRSSSWASSHLQGDVEKSGVGTALL